MIAVWMTNGIRENGEKMDSLGDARQLRTCVALSMVLVLKLCGGCAEDGDLGAKKMGSARVPEAEEPDKGLENVSRIMLVDFDPRREGWPAAVPLEKHGHVVLSNEDTQRILSHTTHRRDELRLTKGHYAAYLLGGGTASGRGVVDLIGSYLDVDSLAGRHEFVGRSRSRMDEILKGALERVFIPYRTHRPRSGGASLKVVFSGGLFGYKDAATGRVVVKPQYVDAMPFAEGLAAVCVQSEDGKRWGFINEKGEMAIRPQFAGGTLFSEGRAAVMKEDFFTGPQLYIDTQGKVAIEGPFEAAYPFKKGEAEVREGGRRKTIDTGGNVIP